MKNKAQQEIVGFVLIVALVMVALMVFLVISLRTQPTEESIEVGNLLNSIMKKTTECAISFEPYYDDFEDLFKSCYNEDTCNNLQRYSCEYLQESLNETIKELLKTEATINSFQLDFLNREGEEEEIFRISGGNCTGQVSSAQKKLSSGSNNNLVIRMRICNN